MSGEAYQSAVKMTRYLILGFDSRLDELGWCLYSDRDRIEQDAEICYNSSAKKPWRIYMVFFFLLACLSIEH